MTNHRDASVGGMIGAPTKRMGVFHQEQNFVEKSGDNKTIFNSLSLTTFKPKLPHILNFENILDGDEQTDKNGCFH